MAFRLRSTSDGLGFVTNILLQTSEMRISIRNRTVGHVQFQFENDLANLIQCNVNIGDVEEEEEKEEENYDDYDDYDMATLDGSGETMADEPSEGEEEQWYTTDDSESESDEVMSINVPSDYLDEYDTDSDF